MKRALSVLTVVCIGLGLAFVGGRLTYQYAYSQTIADAPVELDAGPPAAAPTVTVTAPATSDIAITAQPQAPAATATSSPTTAPAEPKSADAVVDDVVKDVQAGNWRFAAAGVLTLVMIGLRNQRQKWKVFAGKRGGAILVAVLGMGASVVAVLFSSVPLSPQLFMGAAGATFTAVGGWHWFRDVITGDGVTSGEVDS